MRTMKIRINKLSRRLISLTLCTMMLIQLASCGTLLYPERRGQTSGRIDPAVVLMDAIGLLFFIIPGVLAFAVDFSTGSIYLPPDYADRNLKDRLIDLWKGKEEAATSELLVIKVDPEGLNPDAISAIVTKQTGYPVRLDDPRLIVMKVKEEVDITLELERLSQISVAASGLL
jgi:hypothetical protein